MFLNPRIFFKIVLLIWMQTASALPSDVDQKLEVVADSSLINYKTGVNVYEGNVKANQGTTQLMADRITTKNNAQHKIEEAIAIGINRLAEYTTIPKEGDLLFSAQARIMKFYPLKSIIILEKDVVVTQGENNFHGPLIVYNTKDQTIKAPPSKEGRATIVIEPSKLK